MAGSPRTFGGVPRVHNSMSSSLNSNHTNRQLIQANGYPSKIVLDDLVSSHGSLKREIIRSDETLQAIRQENIMLAEKVQHATNLYRQLLGRVSKTEERMQMEHKSVTAVIAQSKNVEQQIVHQKEQLNSKEGQLAMHIQRLQEEVGILKSERESSRKQVNTMNSDIRQLQDRVIRQTSTLSTGLQELRAHLDQKEQERAQSTSVMMGELREKLDSVTHQQTMFQTQSEGRTESLRVQINQNEIQRQDDLYQLNTQLREKEALGKADTRRLQERVKELFEEFNKQMGQREIKLKQDIDTKLVDLDKRILSESKQVQRQVKEHEGEMTESMNEIKETVNDEIEIIKSKVKESHISMQIIEQLQEETKEIDRTMQTNKKDIEKVVRAEISSRLSQGEKLTHRVNQMHKESTEGVTLMQDALGDAKRKQEQAIETNKRDMIRMINEGLKSQRANSTTNQKLETIEKKIEDIEDALDEFAKLLERKDTKLNNTQTQNMKDLRELAKKIKMENADLPSQIRVLEKKLHLLGETIESIKHGTPSRSNVANDEMIKPSPPPPRKGTPLPRPKRTPKVAKLETDVEKLQEIVEVLKDILITIVDARFKKNSKDPDVIRMKERLDELEQNDDTTDDDDDENADGEEKKDKMKADTLKINHDNENETLEKEQETISDDVTKTTEYNEQITDKNVDINDKANNSTGDSSTNVTDTDSSSHDNNVKNENGNLKIVEAHDATVTGIDTNNNNDINNNNKNAKKNNVENDNKNLETIEDSTVNDNDGDENTKNSNETMDTTT